jgi:eukaryotic-like serine/threonine-protein kinase
MQQASEARASGLSARQPAASPGVGAPAPVAAKAAEEATPGAASRVVPTAANVAEAAAAKAAEKIAPVVASVPPSSESRDDALELRLSELEILGPPAPAAAAPPMPAGRRGPVPPPMQRGASSPSGPGQRIAGRFARQRTIALGGMGQVLECVDERLQRRVAVKALRPEFLDNPTATGLLEREAQITASLSHPGIVPVHDLGVDPALGPFYVMPLLEGVTFREVLKQLRDDPAAHAFFRLDRLVRAFIRVCHAVEHAHGRGVVHSDLKPANVVLGDFSEVVLIDWALSYRRGEGLPFRGGTVGYLALEQLDPHCNHFTARTDVFALGSLLYELLTLQPAFGSSTLTEAFAARSKGRPIYKTPLPPSKRAPERRIPDEVAAVCMRALALDPEGRYATVGELVHELEEAADSSWVRLRHIADEAQHLALKAARSLIQSVTPRRRPGR